MPNLKSSPALRRRAVALLDSYSTFVDGTVVQIFANPNETRGPNVVQMRNVARDVSVYAASARDILTSPEAASLEDALRDDLLAIAEESEAFAADAGDYTEPDAVWSKMKPHQKERVISEHRMERESGKLLLARLNLDMRKQKP